MPRDEFSSVDAPFRALRCDVIARFEEHALDRMPPMEVLPPPGRDRVVVLTEDHVVLRRARPPPLLRVDVAPAHTGQEGEVVLYLLSRHLVEGTDGDSDIDAGLRKLGGLVRQEEP